MRVTVVSARGRAAVAQDLSDLGCSVRELPAVSPPASFGSDCDLLLVDAGDDGELGGFVVRRVRGALSPGAGRVPVLLGVARSQLARVDPAWGHDDFVVLPYEAHELYARLRTLEWRASEFSQPERVKIGTLVLDMPAREAHAAGARVELANREFDLLAYLADRRGRVVRREELLSQVFHVRRAGTTRSLDVHVQRLRSKLGASVSIETVRGVGYKLALP